MGLVRYAVIFALSLGLLLIVPNTMVFGGNFSYDFPTSQKLTGTSSDGSIEVTLFSEKIFRGQLYPIEISFKYLDGTFVEHINYDIVAIQDSKEVLIDIGAHENDGFGKHTTKALPSNDPINVAVTLKGIGLATPFSGPLNDVVLLRIDEAETTFDFEKTEESDMIVCPAVCIPMWDLTEQNGQLSCVFNSCGSGCGPDNEITFATENECLDNIPIEETALIPDWVRNIFIWYAEDRISEQELLDAIQFLIDIEILQP